MEVVAGEGAEIVEEVVGPMVEEEKAEIEIFVEVWMWMCG